MQQMRMNPVLLTVAAIMTVFFDGPFDIFAGEPFSSLSINFSDSSSSIKLYRVGNADPLQQHTLLFLIHLQHGSSPYAKHAQITQTSFVP